MFMDENCCLLDVLENLTEFFVKESCGKCCACREGNPQLLHLVQKFRHGTAQRGDLDLLVELGSAMTIGCLCGLGQAAPNPILSVVRFFPQVFTTSDAYAKEVS
jgi:NADH-quinone oxidoreductase subunit F